MSSTYFDAHDTASSASREARLFEDLPTRLMRAVERCPGLGRQLAGHELANVTDRESLRRLPRLHKRELLVAQQADPPFGGFVDDTALAGTRFFLSPGPVWEPQLPMSDPWQSARALHAAGFRRGDRVHNAFSYHLTPGGFILDEGARALGCVVFPAGTGASESQVLALRQSGAVAYTGTPDHLKTLLDRADEEGAPITGLRHALVSGGALFPELRADYATRGIRVMQCYATADVGVIAYESHTGDTVHPGLLVNENLIVEIVRPGSDEPCADGEVGEIVVTRLHPAFPLVRFATGDLSAVLDEPSPCGRTAMRLKGWLGRADERTKVRGMFLDPAQLRAVEAQHPAIERLRAVVNRENDQDVLTLQYVQRQSVEPDLLIDSVRKLCNLGARVERVDDLPNDGRLILDQRDYASDIDS